MRRHATVSKAREPRKFKWTGLLRILLLVICGAILGVNVYLANSRSLVGDQLPMPFGFGTGIVLTGSMEPTFSAGDLIVVKEAPTVAPGDIVVYQNNGILVVHRVITVDGDTVTTQGDANNVADAPIPFSSIKGTVLFHIPGAGNVASFIKSPVGTIGIIVLAIALVEIPNLKKKEKDNAERQKLIDEIRRLKDEE